MYLGLLLKCNILNSKMVFTKSLSIILKNTKYSNFDVQYLKQALFKHTQTVIII